PKVPLHWHPTLETERKQSQQEPLASGKPGGDFFVKRVDHIPSVGKRVTKKAREGPRQYPTSFGGGESEKYHSQEATRRLPIPHHLCSNRTRMALPGSDLGPLFAGRGGVVHVVLL